MRLAKLAHHPGDIAALRFRQTGAEQHDGLGAVALAEGVERGEDIAVGPHDRGGRIHGRRLQRHRVMEMLNKENFGEGAAALGAVDQRDGLGQPEAGEDRPERLPGFNRAHRQRFSLRIMSAMVFS